tara:strand:- start:16500 stop:17072 length:573 start_codon:yes stop_codon:yes gene_type:complete
MVAVASDLDIVNGALSKIGVAPIAAIGEATAAGALAQTTYSVYRDQLLQSHPWNFATKTAALTTTITPIPTGWSQAYQLPADTLRVLEIIGGEQMVWSVEGGDLCVNTTTTFTGIRYIAQITTAGNFSAGFVDALMSKLAAEWAEPLTSSNSLGEMMAKKEELTLREARSFEGQEGSPKVVELFSWTQYR